METIISLGKNLYLRGLYSMRDLESNYAYPCDFPMIFEAYGQAIQSGNWRACTAINTPDSIKRMFEERIGHKIGSLYDIYFVGLNKTEHFELPGLIYAIAKCAEAYEVFRFGNHGTRDGKDISAKDTAKVIFESIKPIVDRANVLLQKITGLRKIDEN